MPNFLSEPRLSVNGFLYSVRITSLAFYEALALNELDPVAQADGFKPWFEVIPFDVLESVPSRGSYSYEFSVPPGSVLWGYLFGLSGLAITINPVAGINFQVTDVQSEEPLFTDFVRSDGQQVSITGVSVFAGLTLLPAPLVVTEPGYIAVELASFNQFSVQSPQLMLCFQVPAKYCQGPANWSEGPTLKGVKR